MSDKDDDLHDLEQDQDDDLNNDTPPKEDEPEVKTGDQDDGSFVAEVDEEAGEKKPEGDGEGANPEDDEDPDRAALRERRRQEKLERKQRAKEREERLKRELEGERTARQQLEQRLSVIERKATGAEMAQIDQAMNQMKTAYNHFKDQIRIGQEAGNGAMVADATEKMMLAQQRHAQLTNIKQAFLQQQQQPAPLNPSVVNHAQKFMEKNKWYRPDGADDDSAITRTIDNKLAAEGWNPATPEYWQELESRIKKYLPHRAGRATVQSDDNKGTQQAQNKPRSPVGGSGREGSASVAPKGTFRLSAERVAALKDAGMWDDPKKREEAIKRFREYDKSQKQGR